MASKKTGEDSRSARCAGLALAGAGVAHFVRPELFDAMSQPIFPRDTRQHIYTNGSIETVLGLGLFVRRTRRLAVVGLLAYAGYLIGNGVRNR